MVHALATQRRVRRKRHRWRKTASGRQHYNYFRDYDPSTGRYVQSDPIGLWGGVTAYGYVGLNSFRSTDPLGLFELAAPAWMYAPRPIPVPPALLPLAGLAGGLAGGQLINSGYEQWRGRSIGSDWHEMLNPNSGWNSAMESERIADYLRYKAFEETGAPRYSDQDPCAFQREKLRFFEEVIRNRMNHTTRFYQGYTNFGHIKAILQAQNGARKARNALRRVNCEESCQ